MLLFSPERYLILGHIWIYWLNKGVVFLNNYFFMGSGVDPAFFKGMICDKNDKNHYLTIWSFWFVKKMSSFYEKMCKQWNNAVFVSFCEMNFFQAINQNRVPTRQRRDYFLNGWKVKTVTVWTDDCEDECDCSRASRNFLVPSSTTKPYFTSYVWIDMTDTN